ncbi:MAG: glycosyltransferase family 39 protein [Anaerolineae bacterium]|nr:glycosyltransferase family 39 protein [Anaerolineae bacterium]
MAYWINSMLAATPALLWVYLGLGIPWALVLLPRKDWRDRVLVICLGFAFGPMLLTAWMFILGSVGGPDHPYLNFNTVLIGTVVLALLALPFLARKRRQPLPDSARSQPLALDEKLLLALIAIATVIRWLVIAYWPFTAYDALWVYGYQGRLYTLLGYIPNSIDYYPQFLQLQYTYTQLAFGVNDHAARAVLPFLNIGSILATYVLGSRLFTRRVGIIAAAIWALYSHMGEWSRFGDLEIPQTFLFTAAATFFLMAWARSDQRRRYALIAGLLLGAALWTKPTAGAFVWGVLLLLVIDLIRVHFDWRTWYPRFEVAFITGLACIPLGGVWYVRNWLLGHDPIVLPTGFWLTQASRSGAEFGWPLLALLLLLLYLFFGPFSTHPNARRSVIGLLLVLAALVPTILTFHQQPADILSHRMGPVEWLLLAAGAILLAQTLINFLPARPVDDPLRSGAAKIGWASSLALPYFVTWFYSYSYHYRLSFAIVPLLLLPTAAILGYWWTPQSIQRWHPALKTLYPVALVLISIPAIRAPLYDTNAGWDWLWTDKLPDDTARYTSGNEALMNVVEGFQIFKQENPDAPLSVVAPGVVRLPFFFPLEDIRTDVAPTRFDQLEGVTYLVYGSPESEGAYQDIPVQENQVVSGFARTGTTVENIMRRAWGKDDGIFRYQVYELHLDRRFLDPQMFHDPQEPVVFGDFARYRGHGIGADMLWPGREIVLQMYWQALAPADGDYTIYLHLRDAEGNVWATWDGPIVSPEFDDGRYYSTQVWEPGEFIVDERRLRLPDDIEVPEADDYSLWFGFYDLGTEERLPVTIDGKPSGDGYRINENIKIRLEEPPPEPPREPRNRRQRRDKTTNPDFS